MPDAHKKYVLLLLLGACLTSALLGHAWLAATDGLGLFLWLALETRRRQGAFFMPVGRASELPLQFDGDLQAVAASSLGPVAVYVEHGPRLTVVDLGTGKPRFSRLFETPPLAAVALPDSRLLWADATSLRLTDAAGVDQRTLEFEPPLLRQSYRLLVSADGSTAALMTPWFAQVFDTELAGLQGRIRYEDAGHFFKYGALAPDGRGLLLAGALLLDEDTSGGGDIEARWDWWAPGPDGAWVKAWGQAHASYSNTHVRGVSVGAAGRLLVVETYQNGYEFRIFDPAGGLLWERPGGEHPVLSPAGTVIAFETAYDGLVVTRVADRQKLWSHKPGAQVRLKAVADDGACLVVEGRRLRVFGPDGKPVWEAWFKTDPDEMGLGPRGALAVGLRRRGAVVRLPWGA